MHYVYYLIDPRNNQPFYIGKGSGERMFCHEKYCYTERYLKDNPLKTLLIREILELGLTIQYSVQPFSDEEAALAEESRLISQYGKIYNNTGTLTNLADGGLGGKKPTKQVHQYSLDGEYITTHLNSATAAAVVSIGVGAIRSACTDSGSNKSAAGSLWSYEKVERLPTWNHALHTPVVQYDKQGNKLAEYPTIAVASATTGIDAGNISACTDRKLKTAGGFVWRNVTDPFSLQTHKACKTVQQLDKQTGDVIAVYPSVKEAAQSTNIESSNISRCCNGKLKSAGGFGWRYA